MRCEVYPNPKFYAPATYLCHTFTLVTMSLGIHTFLGRYIYHSKVRLFSSFGFKLNVFAICFVYTFRHCQISCFFCFFLSLSLVLSLFLFYTLNHLSRQHFCKYPEFLYHLIIFVLSFFLSSVNYSYVNVICTFIYIYKASLIYILQPLCIRTRPIHNLLNLHLT